MGDWDWDDDDSEEMEICFDCGHPLDHRELRYGRCLNCGADLFSEEKRAQEKAGAK